MSSQPQPRKPTPDPIRYEIHDVTGQLVAIHERIDGPEGKRFVWLQPDRTLGLNGKPTADLPLYGIHLLDDRSTVYLGEGEKATDALRAAGVPAVGTVTGAAATPGRVALADLSGRNVVVWPDNEDVGRQHMNKVGAGLARIAADVRMIAWSDAPEHGDAADFLFPHKNAAELHAMAEAVAGGAEAYAPTGHTLEELAALMGAAAPITLVEEDPEEEDGDRWEPPARLDLEDSPPPFPTGALPGWLRNFVDAVAEATQTPPDLAGMLSLATVATVAAGPILVAPAPDWQEGINLFVAVAMEPGSRKSAVFKEVTRPVSTHEQRLADEMGPEIARAAARRRLAEKRLAHLEAQAAKANSADRYQLEADSEEAAVELERLTVPPAPRLFTSDVTSEALGSLLNDHGGRFGVLSPEGGVFDQMAGLYNKGLPNPDVFLKGHAGDTLRVDRRGRPSEYVERPALTLCLAVQPNSLAAVHGNPGLSGRGLLERFLFAVPQSMVGHRAIEPAAVPTEVRAKYESSIETIAHSCDALTGPIILTLSPGAAQLFRAFRTELEGRRGAGGDLTYIATWASKLDGATARLAGLLHVAQEFADGFGRPIDAATMDGAIQIARYLIPDPPMRRR
jgi:hypothetical protein